MCTARDLGTSRWSVVGNKLEINYLPRLILFIYSRYNKLGKRPSQSLVVVPDSLLLRSVNEIKRENETENVKNLLNKVFFVIIVVVMTMKSFYVAR
jgi:hypothetical protein